MRRSLGDLNQSLAAASAAAFAMVVILVAGAQGADFTVVSSFPLVFDDFPADLTLEGSVTVTATADEFVAPLDAYSWLEQTDTLSWSTVFRWFEPQPRVALFADAEGDTVTVIFAPDPRLPLDFERHEIPVLHITTEAENLWDPSTGIYAWGHSVNFDRRGADWERAAHLEYFEADGTLVFAEPIGLRINGEATRWARQKGLRFYFDDYGNSDSVEHDFFGDGPVHCERLVIRPSLYAEFAISSGMAEPLHRELGHPGSRWSFVAVYLNGEYWGAYSLRERMDAKWVEETHEWADDDYIVIKDHDAVCGDYARWESFLAGVQEGDPTSHAWFQWLDSQLDITSYLDWVLLNTIFQTADNMHGKNLAILKIGGDRFRFMAWDEDILFAPDNRYADHFSFYASGDADEYFATMPPMWASGGPWGFTFDWNALLRRGMQNAEFKAALRHRAAEFFAGPMSDSALVDRLDALSAVQVPEWPNQISRWNTDSYHAFASIVRYGFDDRRVVVVDLLADFLATWAELVELTAFAVAPVMDGVSLSWHSEREEDCAGWVVERSLDTPDLFRPVAGYLTHPELVARGGPQLSADYVFVDTTLPADRTAFYRLAHVDLFGVAHVHDWVESTSASAVFALRLNEFLAANDTTLADEAAEFDDWVELYNAGSETVSLGGLFLTDDLEEPARWMLPDGMLGPGEFLVIWCDEDPEQGPYHATFKLDADGEELGLFAGFVEGNVPIDTVVFGAQDADVSRGRVPDGGGDWTTLPAPTPGATNDFVNASPPWQTTASVIRLSPAWPNPGPGQFAMSGFVPSGLGPVRLQVYTVRGELVRELRQGMATGVWQPFSWDGRDAGGRPAAAGVYLLRLRAADIFSQQRVVLLR